MKSDQEPEPEAPEVLAATAGDRLDPGVPGDLDDLGQQGAVLPLERDDLGGQLTGLRRGEERQVRQNLHGSSSNQLLPSVVRLQCDGLTESRDLELQDGWVAVAAVERDFSRLHQTSHVTPPREL